MVSGNFEELEEKLSSRLPAIALETGGLVTETSQDMAIVLRTREDLEKDHLSETCLAAENASALDGEDRQNRENRAAFAILAMFGTTINRTNFPML